MLTPLAHLCAWHGTTYVSALPWPWYSISAIPLKHMLMVAWLLLHGHALTAVGLIMFDARGAVATEFWQSIQKRYLCTWVKRHQSTIHASQLSSSSLLACQANHAWSSAELSESFVESTVSCCSFWDATCISSSNLVDVGLEQNNSMQTPGNCDAADHQGPDIQHKEIFWGAFLLIWEGIAPLV